MDQLRTTSRQNRWVLASCPNTGEEVVGSSWQQEVSVPNVQAMWWHCPACHSWHVRQTGCRDDERCDSE